MGNVNKMSTPHIEKRELMQLDRRDNATHSSLKSQCLLVFPGSKCLFESYGCHDLILPGTGRAKGASQENLG